MHLKNILSAFLRFYVFCAHKEKKIGNRKNEKSLQCNALNTNVSITTSETYRKYDKKVIGPHKDTYVLAYCVLFDNIASRC